MNLTRSAPAGHRPRRLSSWWASLSKRNAAKMIAQHGRLLASLVIGGAAAGCTPNVKLERFNATTRILHVVDGLGRDVTLEPNGVCLVETDAFSILDGPDRVEYRPFEGRGRIPFLRFAEHRAFLGPYFVRLAVADPRELRLVPRGADWRNPASPQPEFFRLDRRQG